MSSVITKVVVAEPVLTVTKLGPNSVEAGTAIAYELSYSVSGNAAAANTVLEDTLPLAPHLCRRAPVEQRLHCSHCALGSGPWRLAGRAMWTCRFRPPHCRTTLNWLIRPADKHHVTRADGGTPQLFAAIPN